MNTVWLQLFPVLHDCEVKLLGFGNDGQTKQEKITCNFEL